jgi:thymidylate synthase (FAD)
MSSKTKMYMNGTIRSWIHYLDLRCGNGTQKEHMDISQAIRDQIFKVEMPVISEALGW